MKMTKIKINSLYGVTHLELDGKPVELRGVKGAGKTSVIDSIRYALTNRSDRDYIVKNGEREGEITIETDTGVNINRKKRTDSSDFIKVTENGKNITAPQSFINDIFTPLQLNPVEFASWDKNAQNRAILDLIEFNWDIDWIKEKFGEIPKGVNYEQHILQVLQDIQAKNGFYYTQREEVNRKELYKRQQLGDIASKFPDGYNAETWASYDLAEKTASLECKRKSNNEIERAKGFIESHNNKMRGLQADRDIKILAEETANNAERLSLEKSIERMQAEIKSDTDKLANLNLTLEDKKKVIKAEYETAVAKLEGDLGIAKQYTDKVIEPVAELQEEINHAIKMKEFVSEYRALVQMQEDCKELKAESERLTTQIQIARELPGEVLGNCKLPVDGLTVKDGIPLVNGLPVSNLSDGEKIELCVDITLAQSQKIEMILLNGVEQLDDNSRQKIYDKCKAKGLQIIAARTTNDSEFTIVEL